MTAGTMAFMPNRTIPGDRTRASAGLVLAATLAGAASLLGCGGGGNPAGGSGSIANQTLSGKIGGQPWTYATGQTESFLSMDDKFFLTLYGEAFTTCEIGGAPQGANEFIIEIPKAPGAYDLSLNMNATFYDAATSKNWVVLSGRVDIESVTATTITGGMNVTLNAGNSINGQFEAMICP
ncbi:MAG: hypothetical protein ABJA82_02565 [Myxococcales bacterium]